MHCRPVQILDHHHHRRQPAARLQELLQQFARAQSDQHTVKAGQRFFRGFQAEQMQQEAEIAQ